MTLAPRAVVVRRATELEELLARHGTAQQAAFFLESRGRTLAEARERHAATAAALTAVRAAIPLDWRRGEIERADVARFGFEPEDVVVVVGQDGLVANVAKYVHGLPVVGVDPEPGRNAGVLVPHAAEAAADLLRDAASGRAAIEERTMVRATADDGRSLVALNEIFVGHPSHQSARYTIHAPDGRVERQSSSGVLAGTGTGATGWLLSVARQSGSALRLPAPQDRALAWFVREPWPSPSTGASVVEGVVGPTALRLVVETDGLVAFGDGIEPDRLRLAWGQEVAIGVAPEVLRLVR